jgi:polyhydroxyalkanoate synthase subunit PhaC
MSVAAADPELTARAQEAAGGGEALGAMRLNALAGSGLRALRHPGTIRGAARLTRETLRIVRGSSEVAPERHDWRFRDATWRENPAYRRLMQFYLAWSHEIEQLAENPDLEWHDTERARFLANIITSAGAPTNLLAGNPEALKRLLETGGGSLVAGTKHMLHDLRHNRGMPMMVNPDAFTVGENLAVTPGAVIYRDDVCEVLQYTPTTPHIRERPVLIVPPQINKYYFLDLAPGRSFVEHGAAHGLPMFMISWRDPTTEQRDWDLDTYAGAIIRAIDVARDVAGCDDVNLLSLCAGGITSSTVLAHLSNNGDQRVRSASFGVTLLDFDVPAPIGMLHAGPLLGLAKFVSRSKGVLDGPSLASVFTWMRPNDLVWNYWVNNYLLGKDPPAFDILAWNSDGTNLPAGLHGQFLDIFRDNCLVKPGMLRVLGTPVDLGRIEVETYVTGATTDHLTPWRGCYRTTQLLSGPSTFILSNAGHIASLVNPPGNPKAHYWAGPEPGADPDAWHAAAQQEQGTWWEHWASWALERSGEERKAPSRLGSRKYRPLEDAPGSYVRGLQPAAA